MAWAFKGKHLNGRKNHGVPKKEPTRWHEGLWTRVRAGERDHMGPSGLQLWGLRTHPSAIGLCLR